MSCQQIVTRWLCGNIFFKVLKWSRLYFLKLSSQFHSYLLLICIPYSLVSELAVQAGWQDGWVPTVPGFDWSRNPWGRPSSSLPPVEPQLPERNKAGQVSYYPVWQTGRVDTLCPSGCNVRAENSC